MDILGLIALARSKGGGSGSGTFVPSFGTLATISTGVSWFGDDPYTLTVLVSGYTVTDKTMISVLPSVDVIEQMMADGVTNIFITNNNGVLTATAVGGAPTAAMTLQVLCSESDVSEDIAGLPAIVGDGIFDTLEANNLTDAVNQLSNAIDYNIPIEISNLQTSYGLNRVNQLLIEGGNIKYINGEFVGIASAFSARTSQNVIPLDGMRSDRRYTLSFKAYTDGNASTTGNGLQFGFKYSDGTFGRLPCPNNTLQYTDFSIQSTSILPKEIVGLVFSYGSAATNVWHIKDIMVVEGATASPYVPYFTANDKTARNDITKCVKNSFFTKPFMSNAREKFAMHRGFRSDTIPWENSIPSFKNAGINHAFACETDVRTTSDGYYICMHDDTVDRTTNGSGTVASMTLDQILALRLKDTTTGVVSDNTVPTFVQYLRICKMYAMVAVAEFKSVSRENLADILSLIEAEGMTDRCIITLPAFLFNDFKKINSTIPIMPTWDSTHDEYTSIIETMKSYENAGICYEQSPLFTQAIVDACHNNGLFVCVWTVDFLSTATTYAEYGVDVTITNNLTSYEQ